MEFLFESVLNSASSLALLIEHSGSGVKERRSGFFLRVFLGLFLAVLIGHE